MFVSSVCLWQVAGCEYLIWSLVSSLKRCKDSWWHMLKVIQKKSLLQQYSSVCQAEVSAQSKIYIRQILCLVPLLHKVKRLCRACRRSSDCKNMLIASLGGTTIKMESISTWGYLTSIKCKQQFIVPTLAAKWWWTLFKRVELNQIYFK